MKGPKRNLELGEFVRTRRESRGLDFYEAARLSGLDHTFWRKLEAGFYESPNPKSLRAVANVLKAPIADLYSMAGYELGRQLPSFRPYLRAKYVDLPSQAIADLERYFEFLRSYYNIPDNQRVYPPRPQPNPEAARARKPNTRPPTRSTS